MHHDTFNADFYMTAATVIPILFLALTLQGRFYGSLITRMSGWTEGKTQWVADVKAGREVASLRQVYGSFLSGCLGILTVIGLPAAWIGEGISIIALYRRSSTAFFGYVTLVILLGLAGLTVAAALMHERQSGGQKEG